MAAQSPTPHVSWPQVCVLKNAGMEKYINVSYTYQPRGLVLGWHIGTLLLHRQVLVAKTGFPSKIFPPENLLFAIKQMLPLRHRRGIAIWDPSPGHAVFPGAEVFISYSKAVAQM